MNYNPYDVLYKNTRLSANMQSGAFHMLFVVFSIYFLLGDYAMAAFYAVACVLTLVMLLANRRSYNATVVGQIRAEGSRLHALIIDVVARYERLVKRDSGGIMQQSLIAQEAAALAGSAGQYMEQYVEFITAQATKPEEVLDFGERIAVSAEARQVCEKIQPYMFRMDGLVPSAHVFHSFTKIAKAVGYTVHPDDLLQKK